MANPAETASLSVRYPALYGLLNSAEKKLQFTPFWGGPKLDCSDGLRASIIESHKFFFLCPILLKLHILARLIESLARTYGPKSCEKEKLSILLEAHHKAQLSEKISKFSAKKIKRAVIFYLLANLAETAYLSFRDRRFANCLAFVATSDWSTEVVSSSCL